MVATAPSKKETPSLPDTSQDFCSVCNTYSAPYIFRDRVAGTVTRYCRTHVPADWASVGIYKSLTRMLEDAWLLEKNKPAGEEAGGLKESQ